MAIITEIIFSFSGVIAFLDNSVSEFSVVLDDQGNIFGNDLDLSDDIVKSITDSTAIDNLLQTITDRYAVQEDGQNRQIASITMRLIGRITYDDNTIKEFASTSIHDNLQTGETLNEVLTTTNTSSFTDIENSTFITEVDEAFEKCGIILRPPTPSPTPDDTGLLFGWEFNDSPFTILSDDLSLPVEINGNNGSFGPSNVFLTGSKLRFFAEDVLQGEISLPAGDGESGSGNGLASSGIVLTNGIKFIYKDVMLSDSCWIYIAISNKRDFPTNPPSGSVAFACDFDIPIGIDNSMALTVATLDGTTYNQMDIVPCNIPVGTYDIILEHNFVNNTIRATITNNALITVYAELDTTLLEEVWANVSLATTHGPDNPSQECTIDSIKIYDIQ